MYNLKAKTELINTMASSLVAVFSKSGHTKSIAEFIAHEIHAPIHEIITEKKYPRTYVMTILESRKEFKQNEFPTLTSEPVPNFAEYSRILLGFPVWFFTCPMAVASWLKLYDFTGKDIYPFCTSGGSTCTKATLHIRELCPGANVHDGIRFTKIDSALVSDWLK